MATGDGNEVAAARYVDAQAYEAYGDHDGQELTVSQLVSGSVDATLDAWVQHEWLARGSTLTPGVGRACVGHRRLLPLGVEEELVSAGLPDGSSKIPSVCYKIRKSGPLLLQDHVAFVQFVADPSAPRSQPKTLVLWTSKLTPSMMGSVLLCGGSLARMVLRAALSQSLTALAALFQQQQKPKSS
ncbi:hypothetical protein BBJ28_00020183 [Nothophytophthora sp. Chile5]|nr:hypothetical protein BBJ28_00020183 [Nothophytophthora sp. Chile5]